MNMLNPNFTVSSLTYVNLICVYEYKINKNMLKFQNNRRNMSSTAI